MERTVEYASSRSEVWRAYWRSWAKPAGLWRFHVGFGVLASVAVFLLNRDSPSDVGRMVTTAVVATLLSVALLPLWPLVCFKEGVRSLTIGPSGFTTRIGTRSGTRSWGDVSSVEDTGKEILIVGADRNAMIVPERAFENDAARRSFFEAAAAWHRSNRQSPK